MKSENKIVHILLGVELSGPVPELLHEAEARLWPIDNVVNTTAAFVQSAGEPFADKFQPANVDMQENPDGTWSVIEPTNTKWKFDSALRAADFRLGWMAAMGLTNQPRSDAKTEANG